MQANARTFDRRVALADLSNAPRVSSSKLVLQWMMITLIASIVGALDGGWLAGRTALIPSRVLHGEVWRLVTWPFIEPGPTTLFITVLATYKFGTELAFRWGDQLLQRFMIYVVLAAAIGTCLLALVAGQRYMPHLGGWAVADALVIAWARQFPDKRLVLYQLIALNGRRLIQFTIATNVVFAIYYGPSAVAPELMACVAAAVYPPRRLPR